MDSTAIPGSVGAATKSQSDDRAARIREAVDILCHGVVEIRVLDVRQTDSGYYDTSTPEGVAALLRDVLKRDGHVSGIYYTLNQIDPRCLRRAHNKMRMRVGDRSTTSDSHVTRRRLLGFDFDVKRPADTSATDAEVQTALAIAKQAQRWLVDQIGVRAEAIIYGMTGNGACLLVRIDEPNDSDTTALVKRCLSAMAYYANTAEVQIDPRVFNASRIWRLPGTLAAKGDADCPDAAHRRAEILEAAAVRVTCPRAVLEARAERAPQDTKPHETWRPSGTFDLAEWITRSGIDVKKDGPWEDGWRWKLARCLTDESHTHGEAFIVRRGHGGIAAGCQHASCTWGWRELREHYEPGCYDQRRDDSSRSSRSANETRHSGTTATPRLYRVVSARESLSLPPVEYRVDGMLPEKGAGALIGASGDGKGLVSMNLAIPLASGQPYRAEIPVKQCPVALVIAEGWAGIPQRVRAALDYHRVSDTDLPLYFIPASPKLNIADDLQRLLDTLASLPQVPRVVGIDTLARTLSGNENDTEDMGNYGAGLHAIAEAVDGFAFTIHHTGWDKSRERGNSALRATVDMMALVAREDRIVTLSCTKQKDGPDFAPMRFRLDPHLESVVLTPIGEEEPTSASVPTCARELPRYVRMVMETLRDSFGDDGASPTNLMRTSGVPDRGFFRAVKEARGWGFLLKQGRSTYQLTIAGREILTLS